MGIFSPLAIGMRDPHVIVESRATVARGTVRHGVVVDDSQDDAGSRGHDCVIVIGVPYAVQIQPRFVGRMGEMVLGERYVDSVSVGEAINGMGKFLGHTGLSPQSQQFQ